MKTDRKKPTEPLYVASDLMILEYSLRQTQHRLTTLQNELAAITADATRILEKVQAANKK